MRSFDKTYIGGYWKKYLMNETPKIGKTRQTSKIYSPNFPPLDMTKAQIITAALHTTHTRNDREA